MLYSILKWLHILAAIVAVGSNTTYQFWMSRGEQHPDRLPFILKSIQYLDRRMANPAYGLLFLLGIGMIVTGRIPLATPWLLTSIILYITLAILGALVYSPILKNQIRTLETQTSGSSEYRAIARRARITGIILLIVAFGIVFLMVVKPRLWG